MKKSMLTLALALGLAAAGSGLALAQQAPAGPVGPGAGRMMPMQGQGHGWHDRGDRHGRMQARGPAGHVIATLGRIERLYAMQGDRGAIDTLYRDVLKRTQDPMVRRFAYGRLARNELKPADTRKAIATLRQSLDESLKLLDQRDARRAARMSGNGPR